jgi:hypothetical protein
MPWSRGSSAIDMDFSSPYPAWLSVWIWLHVFLIDLTQRVTFMRHDVASMLRFRLACYLAWHVAWVMRVFSGCFL